MQNIGHVSIKEVLNTANVAMFVYFFLPSYVAEFAVEFVGQLAVAVVVALVKHPFFMFK